MTALRVPLMVVLKDYIELTKPRIALFCILMTWGGMLLGAGNLTDALVFNTLLGTTLSVASANVFNMYIEREGDKSMRRTRGRPLPAGRVRPNSALMVAILLGVASWVVLDVFVNRLTALIGLFAIVSYAFVYTPLKRKSSSAIVIGAVPGAVPPLMGVTAVTNEIDQVGFILFAILFLWQIPHFCAIAMYHAQDYSRAGIKTLSIVLGDEVAKVHTAGYAVTLLITSLLLVPAGVAGWTYFFVALAAGGWFVWESFCGFSKKTPTPKWARRLFIVSIIYLPLLTAGLMLDILLR